MEILTANLEQPTPKYKAPSPLILDETDLLNQWLDRSLLTRDKLNTTTPWMERGCHLYLIWLLIGHARDGSKLL